MAMPASHALHPSLAARARRPLVVGALAWVGVALVAALQTVAMARLRGGADLAAALLARLSILPLWAAATPAILRSARRFPVLIAHRRVSPGHLAAHVAFGSLFIVAANVIIRLPLLGGPGVTALARSTLDGLATYYPLALIVYGVIVAIGHAVGRAGDGPHAPTGAASDAPGAPTSDGANGRWRSLPQPFDAGEPSLRADLDVRGGPPRDEPAERAAGVAATHLPVRQWNRVHLVRVEEIDWIEAEDNYVVVHAAGRGYKGRERIAGVEARLDPRRFVRIHRSAIVHVARIREVQPLTHGDHAVILRDGTVLRVARSRRQALARALGVEL